MPDNGAAEGNQVVKSGKRSKTNRTICRGRDCGSRGTEGKDSPRPHSRPGAETDTGVDGIIFTAGIGENSAEIREKICNGFEYAGVVIDQEANYHSKGERFISTGFSPIKVMVIPTNEELIMARDAYQLVEQVASKNIAP